MSHGSLFFPSSLEKQIIHSLVIQRFQTPSCNNRCFHLVQGPDILRAQRLEVHDAQLELMINRSGAHH